MCIVGQAGISGDLGWWRRLQDPKAQAVPFLLFWQPLPAFPWVLPYLSERWARREQIREVNYSVHPHQTGFLPGRYFADIMRKFLICQF